MNRLGSGLLAGTAAIVGSSTFAAAAGPTFKFVPGSLVELSIERGPWTLHEAAPYAHDASGIVPTTPGPPYSGSGTPYAGYCSGTFPAVNHGRSVMQPYYFPFVRKQRRLPRRLLRLSPAQRAGSDRRGDLARLGQELDFQGRGAGAEPVLPGGSDRSGQ